MVTALDFHERKTLFNRIFLAAPQSEQVVFMQMVLGLRSGPHSSGAAASLTISMSGVRRNLHTNI